MARISSYPRDREVQDEDSWIGTESSNRVTRNFSAKAIAEYLNIKGKISISSQMVFQLDQATVNDGQFNGCLLYTSPSPRDRQKSRMPSSA